MDSSQLEVLCRLALYIYRLDSLTLDASDKLFPNPDDFNASLTLVASIFPKLKYLTLKINNFDLDFELVKAFKELDVLTISFIGMKDLYKYDNPYNLKFVPQEIDNLCLEFASNPTLEWIFRRLKPRKTLNIERSMMDAREVRGIMERAGVAVREIKVKITAYKPLEYY